MSSRDGSRSSSRKHKSATKADRSSGSRRHAASTVLQSVPIQAPLQRQGSMGSGLSTPSSRLASYSSAPGNQPQMQQQQQQQHQQMLRSYQSSANEMGPPPLQRPRSQFSTPQVSTDSQPPPNAMRSPERGSLMQSSGRKLMPSGASARHSRHASLDKFQPLIQGREEPVHKFRLQFSAGNLFGNIDAVLAVFHIHPQTQQLHFINHTEIAIQTSHPEWCESVLIPYNGHQSSSRYQFNIYAAQTSLGNTIHEEDRLASCQLALGEIIRYEKDGTILPMMLEFPLWHDIPAIDQQLQTLGSKLSVNVTLELPLRHKSNELYIGPQMTLALSDALMILTRGAIFTKYSTHRTVKPSKRFVFYEPPKRGDTKTSGCLYWCLPGRRERDPQRMIAVNSITGLYESNQTLAFQRYSEAYNDDPSYPHRCFSIVTKHTSLDLEAGTQATRDTFLYTIHHFLQQHGFRMKEVQGELIDATLNTSLTRQFTDSGVVLDRFFVLQLKCLNLPTAPWAMKANANDTCVACYLKTSSNEYKHLASTEWLHSTSPTFTTRIHIQIPTDSKTSSWNESTIRLGIYDSQFNDSHLLGYVTLKYQHLMRYTGQTISLRIVHPSNSNMNDLLTQSETRIELSATVKVEKRPAQSASTRYSVKSEDTKETLQHTKLWRQHGAGEESYSAMTSPPATVKVEPVAQHTHAPTQQIAHSVSGAANQLQSPDASPLTSHMGVTTASSHSRRASRNFQSGAASTRNSQSVGVAADAFLAAGEIFTLHFPDTTSGIPTYLPAAITQQQSLQVQLYYVPDHSDLLNGQFVLYEHFADSELGIAYRQADPPVLVLPIDTIECATKDKSSKTLQCDIHSEEKDSKCMSLYFEDENSVRYSVDLSAQFVSKRDAWYAAIEELMARVAGQMDAEGGDEAEDTMSPAKPVGHRRQRSSTNSVVSPSKPGRNMSKRGTLPLNGGDLAAALNNQGWHKRTASGSTSSRNHHRTSTTVNDGTDFDLFSENEGDDDAETHSSGEDSDDLEYIATGGRKSRGGKSGSRRGSGKYTGFGGSGTGAESGIGGGSGHGDGSSNNTASAGSGKGGSSSPAPAFAPTSPRNHDSKPTFIIGAAAPPPPPPPPMAPSIDAPTAPPMAPPMAPAAPPMLDFSNASNEAHTANKRNSIVAPAIGSYAPGAPPMLPSSPAGPKMKRLHWEVLPPVENKSGTVWAEMSAEGGLLTDDSDGTERLSAMFAVKPVIKRQPSNADGTAADGAAEKPAVESLIDSKRAHNIEIQLRSFRLTHTAIRDAILQCDIPTVDNPNGLLTTDRLQILCQACPEMEEIATIRNFKGDLTTLTGTEQFFACVGSVPRLQQRLNALLFMSRFQHVQSELTQQYEQLLTAGNDLRTSKQMKKVMEIVLSVGNYLNRGTRTGGAYGFKLHSLTKLHDTRSGDNSMTLIDFIVEYVEKLRTNNQAISDIAGDTPSETVELLQAIYHRLKEDRGYLHALSTSIKPAAKIDWKSLQHEKQSVVTQITQLETELKLANNRTGGSNAASPAVEDLFATKLQAFLDSAKSTVDTLNTQHTEVVQLSSTLSTYYGEDTTVKSDLQNDITLIFTIFATFIEQYERSEVRWYEKLEVCIRKAQAVVRNEGAASPRKKASSVEERKEADTTDQAPSKPSSRRTSLVNGVPKVRVGASRKNSREELLEVQQQLAAISVEKLEPAAEDKPIETVRVVTTNVSPLKAAATVIPDGVNAVSTTSETVVKVETTPSVSNSASPVVIQRPLLSLSGNNTPLLSSSQRLPRIKSLISNSTTPNALSPVMPQRRPSRRVSVATKPGDLPQSLSRKTSYATMTTPTYSTRALMVNVGAALATPTASLPPHRVSISRDTVFDATDVQVKDTSVSEMQSKVVPDVTKSPLTRSRGQSEIFHDSPLRIRYSVVNQPVAPPSDFSEVIKDVPQTDTMSMEEYNAMMGITN